MLEMFKFFFFFLVISQHKTQLSSANKVLLTTDRDFEPLWKTCSLNPMKDYCGHIKEKIYYFSFWDQN